MEWRSCVEPFVAVAVTVVVARARATVASASVVLPLVIVALPFVRRLPWVPSPPSPGAPPPVSTVYRAIFPASTPAVPWRRLPRAILRRHGPVWMPSPFDTQRFF